MIQLNFSGFTSFVHTYRLHVIMVYILASILFVGVFEELTYFVILPMVCFTSLCAGSYLINRYFDVDADTINEVAYKIKNKVILLWLSIFFITLPFFLLIVGSFAVSPFFIFTPISFLYSYKLMEFRFKDFWLTKNMFAALMWYVSWVIVVVCYGKEGYEVYEIFKITWPWIPLLLTYELLWDLRDVKGDMQTGTSTIPTVFGFKFSKYLALVMFFVFLCATLYITQDIIFSAGYLPVAVGIVLLKSSTKAFNYHLFIYYQIVMLSIALILWS